MLFERTEGRRHFPSQGQRISPHTVDREEYRERNVVERPINRIEPWRRIATRYEKRVATSLATLTVAAILLWLEVRARDAPGAHYGVGVPADGVAGAPTAFPAR